MTLEPGILIIASLTLSFIPLLLGTLTSYLKVSIVFGMIKTGLGTQHVPGTLLTAVLSFLVSMIIMNPVTHDISVRSEQLSWKKIQQKPSVEEIHKVLGVLEPLKSFLKQQSGEREIRAIARMQKKDLKSESLDQETAWSTLIPAFMLSELKEAFTMSFVLLLPFLAIDLIVSNILVGFGMTMVSPIVITVPLKLILFVLSDGWLLLTQGLIQSYGVGVS